MAGGRRMKGDLMRIERAAWKKTKALQQQRDSDKRELVAVCFLVGV